MDIIIRDSPQAVGAAVADRIDAVIRAAQGAPLTLGLATGSSPEPAYEELIRRFQEQGLSFAHCQAFLLDEYVGLSADHEQSYAATIRRMFTRHVDIDDAKVHSPQGDAQDPEQEVRRYDAAISDAGGVDVQILGIGRNGHIAFNEPTGSLASRTHVQVLAQSTVEANARFFASEDEVPSHAMSQGLGTIMEARKIVLVALGEDKAEAVKELVEGAVSARWPGTILQHHPDVTVVVDEAAASLLELRDFYATLERDRQDRQAELSAPAH